MTRIVTESEAVDGSWYRRVAQVTAFRAALSGWLMATNIDLIWGGEEEYRLDIYDAATSGGAWLFQLRIETRRWRGTSPLDGHFIRPNDTVRHELGPANVPWQEWFHHGFLSGSWKI